MSEIVPFVHQPPAFSADWLRDPAEIAQRIGGTDFVPASLRNSPAAITAALLYGAEVGLGPMQSLARIAVINGRPTMAAEAQRALILHAGHDLWIDELTVTRCTIAGMRKGSDQISRVTWTIDDARRAGLAGRQAWRQYPRQMLLARASAELARAVFPDAIAGLAASEELEDQPELAQAADGPEPEPAKTTRRRRRASVTASPADQPLAGRPPAGSPPEGGAQPDQEPAAAGLGDNAPAASAPGELPPDEQAVVDQIRREFNATEHSEPEPTPEPPRPQPEPAPEPPARMTNPQRSKMMALFRDKGMEERSDRLAYCSKLVGRSLASSDELTFDEASAIIDTLENDGVDWPWRDFTP